MISSGLYWLTSNLSFSSFSAPLSSAIKGDFSPCIDCIHNDSVADVSKYLDKDSNTTYWLKIIHLQPSRVSSHGPGHPWKHLCVPVCVAAITGLYFSPIPLKKKREGTFVLQVPGNSNSTKPCFKHFCFADTKILFFFYFHFQSF